MGITSGFGKNEGLFSGIGSLNLLAAGIGLLIWAAVGPDAHVTSDQVTLGPGRAYAMGEPAVFGRENVDGVAPDEVLTRCTRTSSVYGVG
ncbi:hypothetical protein GCM10009774_06000 [Cellulomonas gelida]|uniref:Uncharacterized protein n=1 Tax=Cellulomonas gelida TaxID=1712 RepID=A0A4Y3KP88_9CELL|nr:hypothetical protein CGE01nite_22260 [Cellulomonas gelida]GGL18495.1 hypothetical protein GCM10009774_06000 [Cellulomonas gelida]